ncbi:MAG: ribosomal RNA small subunit methyltransferase A [Deltaproteobacteria bacterium]|nr:ribosomal RNA small subunit methyltransferase A [Deltaproteobacteria bacterium]
MPRMVHAAVRSVPLHHPIHPKRSWSQNFLCDASIAVRIAEEAETALGNASGRPAVLELGAGTGALTRELAARCPKVFALERDRDLAAVLRRKFAGTPNVEVLEDNALTISLQPSAFSLQPLVVVGNLPYHIASQIIFHLIDEREAICTFILMLQKELAERICAGPGSRTYGVISVMCALHTKPRILFDVGPSAFHPRPRVVSSAVRFDVRSAPAVEVEDESVFRRVVRAAFSQRRKTLANSLKPLFPDRTSLHRSFEAAAIDPGCRAETLGVAGFARLAAQLPHGMKDES